jgi:phosphatidylglycerophosphatase A
MTLETSEQPSQRKPRVALLIATGFGLGYLPKAPGTWGSLGGVALSVVCWSIWAMIGPRPQNYVIETEAGSVSVVVDLVYLAINGFALVVAGIGVWVAGRAAEHFGGKDPQSIVIDEISGQQMALLGVSDLLGVEAWWKYLLLGFILFRVFDIWKPFPVRRAEKWPGGWGIMADDWAAALYAAAGLWIARALGL